MNITRENYEIYVIDYLEGTMSFEMEEAFMDFLSENPDIREEIEGLSSFSDEELPIEEISLDKKGLHRTINDQKINLNNYEEFVIAKNEGDLTIESLKDLKNFIAEHPELEKDIKALELTFLKPDTSIVYPDKSLLIHSSISPASVIHSGNYEEYLIAWLEGDLSDKEVTAVKKYLKDNPSANEDLVLLQQTFIKPDHSITFANKHELKQQAAPIFMLNRSMVYRATAFAASIAILVGLWIGVSNNNSTPVIDLASVQSTAFSTLPNNIAEIPQPEETEQQTNFVTLKSASSVTPKSNQTNIIEEVPSKHNGRTLASLNIRETNPEVAPIDFSSKHPVVATAPATTPANEKRSIDAYTQYIFGGNNQKPGFVSDITLAEINQKAETQSFLNRAGQSLYAMWSGVKENFRLQD